MEWHITIALPTKKEENKSFPQIDKARKCDYIHVGICNANDK
jgi:hypothetical protein